MKKKDYVAKITIEEFPRTEQSLERLVNWLREKAKDIKKDDPDSYSEPCNFKLMK